MKTRVVWDNGVTHVELIPENAGETQVLTMLEEKAAADVRVEWEGANKQYRKLIKVVLTV